MRCLPSAICEAQIRNFSEHFGANPFDLWVNCGMFFPLYEREKN
jgi:hypothetical protein